MVKTKVNINTIQSEIESIRQYVKSRGNKFVGKKLSRNVYEFYNLGVCNDGISSLDEYYVKLINDVLFDIRHCKPAWVFSLQQVAEIFKFEPNVRVTYDKDDMVFYIN